MDQVTNYTNKLNKLYNKLSCLKQTRVDPLLTAASVTNLMNFLSRSTGSPKKLSQLQSVAAVAGHAVRVGGIKNLLRP